ncbi:DUF4296 domain-containing protein [Winogradskyella aurantia]|uniref:DUF4296 domain-containing protein n=1 Tax=Winogradskyella aurantia TaxID=1915063 RepID=A0A265UZD5_9FLAO|nr:DUF4296 domain-containing protein [Winogradskyella aurantia]OZV70582.1 hypothetical protein CA834_00250 [Winogradskyella aurantia]
MVNKWCTIFGIFIFFFGCSGRVKPKKPDNLISKEKMTEILYDLYIINGAKNVNKKLLEEKGFAPKTYVLRKYNIDSTQFAESNTYYAFDPDAYRDLVERIKTRIENEKESVEELQKKERQEAKLRQDSIKSINNNKAIQKKINIDTTISIKPNIKN